MRRNRFAPSAQLWVALAIVGVLPFAAAYGEDWPQFRGPNASGVSTSTKSLPAEFSTTENLRWSVKIGDGVGSPIIHSGKVFATAMTAEQKFGVFCFDAASGKRIWAREFE